jgi:hypothetical protein
MRVYRGFRPVHPGVWYLGVQDLICRSVGGPEIWGLRKWAGGRLSGVTKVWDKNRSMWESGGGLVAKADGSRVFRGEVECKGGLFEVQGSRRVM